MAHHPSRRAAVLAVLASAAVVGGSIAVVATATPAAAAGLSPFDIVGRGATVPFVEHEAEEVAHNGTKIGPTRFYGQLPSEASGREAVTLDAVGEYVEFTLTAPANAVTFRYSIPDSPQGTGRDATIDLRANGTLLKTVPVTSRYGWYYGGYPFNNNPGDTNPHHFYDEARAMFGSTQPIGTKIRLQVNSIAQSPTFTIDLADFENVPGPIGQPANSINVVNDFGADPSGATDSTADFQAAVNAGQAQGRAVYVPQGNYTLYDHVIVDGVTLRGAGPWYSVLGGRHPTQRNRAAGIYGKYVNQGGPSRNVTVRDLAVIGDIRERVDEDQVNAFGGAMSDSVIDNVWMQHTKVGAWMDGPMNNFTIRNSRILDQTADGVNFHTGVTNSTVTNTFVRNTGDDALAMWAQDVPNVNNSFTRNTIGVTLLANHLVSYGGRDITISDNVVADSLTNGGGIHVANRYPGVQGATAVHGTWTIARNTLIRAGNSDYNWNFGVGAIWFSALNEAFAGDATINITDTDILDSSYAALHWIEGQTRGINVNNVRIQGAGTYALQVQAPSQVSFTNVTASGIAQSNPIHNCVGPSFQITQGAGNSGWYTATPFCGPWPAPQWNNGPTNPPTSSPPAPSGQLTADPASVTFGTQNVNTTSAPRTVTIRNTGTAAAPISSVSTEGDFAQTNNCPSSLAVNATCTANVTFRPTATGARNGNLRIGALAVPLTGTGFDTAGNLAAGRPTTATSQNGPYVAGNTVDGNAASYWEGANGSFPQSVTVDLGSAQPVNRLVLKLPTNWETRTQNITVLGSTDGGSYAQILGATNYTFNQGAGNTVTVNLPASNRRYVRLTFNGNNVWPAAQLSEFEVYGGGGGPTAPALSVSPGSLTFPSRQVGTTSPAQQVTVTNTGNASAGITGVSTTGNFAQTNGCGSSLGAGASCTVNVTFTPTGTGTRTGTLSVASNAPGSPHTVGLTGTGTTTTPPNVNLALNRPITETSHADVYGAPNAVDGNANTYWESANNAFPQSLTVDLGSAQSVSRVVLKLPPAAAWQTRTQTVAVLGSTTGSSYTTLSGAAGRTFNPATGNSVTITFPATSQRYLRLTFTGNTGWPAGQISESEVYAS
jgi:F5/8 type C domain/Pectate lyase superfamily protein/Abnormal spindle-like microcephaly-assoc'd, ASPM-SPD-2-Hydin